MELFALAPLRQVKRPHHARKVASHISFIRATPVAAVPALKSLQCRVVTARGKGAVEGNSNVKGFIRKYLPLLAYHNPALVIQRVATTEAPCVVAVAADGSSRTLDCAALTDKDILAELTGTSGIAKADKVVRFNTGRTKRQSVAGSAAAAGAPAAVAAGGAGALR